MEDCADSSDNPSLSSNRSEDAISRDISAMDRIVSLVNVRDRSVAEIEERLNREGYSPEDVCRAIDRAESCGILSDARFADLFIRSKIRSGWGRIKIQTHLGRYGIDVSTIQGYPERYFDCDSEEERASAILAKRPVPSMRPVEKMARHLVSKGFDFDVSFQAARRRVEASTGIS